VGKEELEAKFKEMEDFGENGAACDLENRRNTSKSRNFIEFFHSIIDDSHPSVNNHDNFIDEIY